MASNPTQLQLTGIQNTYRCSETLDVGFLTVYVILGLATLVGNTICSVVFLATPHLRKCYMNVFLVGLSVADISSAVFVIPGHAAFCTSCSSDYFMDVLDAEKCRILDAVKDYVWLASIFSLLGITYDRYLAVIQPLRYGYKMTTRKAITVLLITWLSPLPIAFIKPIFDASHEEFISVKSHSESVYDIVVVASFIMVPMVALFVVNMMILKAIKLQLQRVDTERRRSSELVITRQENRRRTTTCLIVVLIFLVSWLPRCLLNLLHFLKMHNFKVLKILEKISLLFIFLQSVVNPFVYSFYRRDFREAAKNLLKKPVLLPRTSDRSKAGQDRQA